MSNKPIINGIDVSECPHYDKVAGCFHTLDGTCIKDKCSIYKLIFKNQCLQEENEELKKQLEFSRTHKTVLDAERIKYKQALEEIKNLAELEVMLDKNSKAFYPANIQRILDVINEVLSDRD